MLIFWKEKLALLAVPKTGTTALEEVLASQASMAALEPPVLKHTPLYRFNRFIRPMLEKAGLEDVETVALVREPVDWLGSWYRYRRRPFMEGKPASTREMDFDSFVKGYMRNQRPAFADVGSQARFLSPGQKGPGPDRLFRYEDQAAFVAFLETRLSQPIELPRRNVSPDAETVLSPGVARRLREKCAEDFALWDSLGTAAVS